VKVYLHIISQGDTKKTKKQRCELCNRCFVVRKYALVKDEQRDTVEMCDANEVQSRILARKQKIF
jgi:hypothetical protein